VASMSTPTRATPFAIDDRAQTLSRTGLITTGLVTTGLVTTGLVRGKLVRKVAEHRTNLSIASDTPRPWSHNDCRPSRWVNDADTRCLNRARGYGPTRAPSR
jgi:hypothetical protein